MPMRPQTLRLALAGGAFAILALVFTFAEVPSAADRALAAYPAGAGGVPEVRVWLLRDPAGADVEVTGPFKLFGAAGREIEIRNTSLASVRVRGSGGGLAVGSNSFRQDAELVFRPEPGAEVRVGDVPVPGAAAFVRELEGDGVAVAAIMDVEGYACAAVAARADWRAWAEATLAACAVCLRTRALYDAARSVDMTWDFEEPGLLEVFRTGAWRSARVARAVNLTRGIALAWDGRLFPAHMTEYCAGKTEDASPLFAAASITPLSGVDCPHCAKIAHPRATWTARLSREALAERLRPAALAAGVDVHREVRWVEIVRAGLSSPRAARLRIDTAYGAFEIDAETFRAALGADVLPSSWFEVNDAGPGALTFVGRGVGSGVGLCQFGAEAMAREGAGYEEILHGYFPGAALGSLPYRGRRGATDNAAMSACLPPGMAGRAAPGLSGRQALPEGGP